MPYQTDADIADNASFKARVRQAMTDVALDVAAEATNTPNHANRVAFSRFVLLNDCNNVRDGLIRAIPIDGLTGTGSTDPALKSRIAQLWDAFSGVA